MFKVGDKVVVIDPSGNHNFRAGEVLEISSIQPKDGEFPDLIRCKGKPGGMFDYRFKLYEEKPVVDFTKPVTTRDGRKVRILCTNVAKTDYPILGLVTYRDGSEGINQWLPDGRAYNTLKGTGSDLINPPVKKYINLFPDGANRMYFDSREEAEASGRASKNAGYIKTIEVEL